MTTHSHLKFRKIINDLKRRPEDAATDLTGYDLTATTTLSLGDLTVGYGDKEGTGEYYTYGINKEIGSSLKVYAEMQDANLDTNVDTRSWSIGT